MQDACIDIRKQCIGHTCPTVLPVRLKPGKAIHKLNNSQGV